MSRTLTNASYTMTYPNELHYAFNPAIVKLSSLAAGCAVSIRLTCEATGQTFIESREAYGGEATFDINRFLQMTFAKIYDFELDYARVFVGNIACRYVAINVVITNADKSMVIVPTINMRTIWGALSRDEISGGEVISRRFFIYYPFTVDIDTANDDEFEFELSSSGVWYSHDDSYMRATVNVQKNIEAYTANGIQPADKTLDVAVYGGTVIKNDVQQDDKRTMYRLIIDRTRGDKYTYLRWIDSQGRISYYLFKKIGSSTAITATAWNASDMRVKTTYDNGVNKDTDARQSFTQTQSQTIGVKLVDRKTYAFLLGAAKSPIVDVFDGYDAAGLPLWHRVNIAAATFAETLKEYQDFQMTIVEPKQSTQIL